jgi:mannitol-specific phosphotransferase system IIBC component
MQATGEAERMSLTTRMVNVVVAPGELFEALARAPFSVANWLVPAALVALVGIVCQLIMFAQPAMAQQIREMQDHAIQAKVDAGEMKQADADKAKEMMEGIGLTIAKVAGALAMAVMAVVGPLWWGFLAWLVGRWVFRSPLPYWRGVEVAGLGALIGVLGMLVGTFLAVGLGKLFAGPHAGLLVKEFDALNRGHLALAALNPFSLWYLGVVAMGTARLIGRPAGPVALVLLGLWLGYKGVAVVLKLTWLAF